MDRIFKFKTFDGAEHNTRKEAIEHLDGVQGEICEVHAKRIVQLTKYKDVLQYLLDNFASFDICTQAEKDRIVYDYDD